MISNAKFEELLSLQESLILDFKQQMYDLSSEDKIAALVKDIISMINTKRASSSHIIIGVKANPNGENQLLGIDTFIDESIIQEKIKNKITPTPEFSYYIKEFNDLKFGVLEFPVIQYPSFLYTPIKLKGLDPSVPYYRLGTSNQEAKGHKVIEIYEWITKISKSDEAEFSREDWIMDILIRINENKEPLSTLILEAYELGLEYKIEPLLNFCSTEIKGIGEYPYNENYRLVDYYYCYGYYSNLTSENETQIAQKLLLQNNYIVTNYFMKMPISEIETYLNKINKTGGSIILDCSTRFFNNRIKLEDAKAISIFLHPNTLEDALTKIKNQLNSILVSLN